MKNKIPLRKLIALIVACSFCLIFMYSCLQDHRDPESTGRIEITGVATAEFPKGTATDKVIFETRTDEDINGIFDELAETYKVGKALPYQIYLNVGPSEPTTNTVKVTFRLPSDFVNSKPGDHGFEVFALIYQDGGDAIYDNFDIIPSKYDPRDNTLTATLPSYVFSAERNADKTFEAIFRIGTTPGENLSGGRLKAPQAGECEFGQLSCPLGSFDLCTTKKGSPFGKRDDPLTGAPKTNHLGIDFKVPEGTRVFSASNGVVETIFTNHKDWGRTILVRHENNALTLYAHLSTSTVKKGDPVSAGAQIGLSGKTGGRVRGAHLHFEYLPNGKLAKGKNRIDPGPCISPNQNGSITIRDNGTLADDAFAAYLDGEFIGRTEIGQQNSLALSNLRPGDKILRLVCTVAPDNVGTYEILLNDGILFKGDGNRFSSTLPQGGSQEFIIVIPQNSNNIQSLLGPAQSQPNAYIEK